MTLSIQTFILGPLQNNTYLIADEETRQAVLIDPSFGAKTLLPQIEKIQLASYPDLAYSCSF